MVNKQLDDYNKQLEKSIMLLARQERAIDNIKKKISALDNKDNMQYKRY